ncbi:MAG: phosphatase PAP2 family protein [Anaerolineae bacterium]
MSLTIKKLQFTSWQLTWILLVAVSRVYLGVHYPSDVLASLAVGIVWLILILSFLQDHIISQRES